MTRLRLNFVRDLTYAPLMIAKDNGYFEDEGIDVEFISLDFNSTMLAAPSGKLDVLSLPVSAGIFNMIHRGVALQVVADKGHSEPGCVAEAFVAPFATADRIAKTKSFRDENFVVLRAGVTEYLVNRLLKQHGLTDSDIRFTQIASSEHLQAMQQKLDAVIYTREPKLSNMISQGLVRIVAATEQINPGHQYSVVTFGKRLLHDDPELGRRFMRAYLRGVRRYNEGKTDDNVAILSRHTKLSPEIIRRACWISIAKDGRIEPEKLEDYFTWARAKGYLDAELPASRWWNPAFIEAAAADEVAAAPAAAR